VNAYKADDSGKLVVILMAQDFRLPEVLRHIEAGRIVLVIPATRRLLRTA
jgi:nitrate reductase NapAB chaperone NapD